MYEAYYISNWNSETDIDIKINLFNSIAFQMIKSN